MNSFKRNSGFCQEHHFFAWITTFSTKMTTFFRCHVMSLDAYTSKLLFKDKLVQERFLDLFLSFLNLFEVKAYFKLYPYFILSLFILLIYFFFLFWREILQKQTKIPLPLLIEVWLFALVKKVECPELNGKRMRSVSEIGAVKHFLLNTLSCTQSNKF